MKLLTLNVFQGSPIFNSLENSDRLKQQIRAVKKLNPDIICLQELTSHLAYLQYKEAFSEYKFVSTFNSSPNIIVCLILLLCFCAYPSISLPILIIAIRFPALHWLIWQNSGLVVALKKKYSVLYKKEKTYETQTGDWMNYVCPRKYVNVKFVWDDRVFSLINTHLNAFGEDEHRGKQLKEVLGADIICGDFNTHRLSLSSYLQDPTEPTYDRQNEYCTWGTTSCIDHVWVKNRKDVYMYVKSKLVFTNPPISDHYGVLSTIYCF